MNIQRINFSTKNYLGNFKGNTINRQQNQNEKYQEYLPTSSIPTEAIKAYFPLASEKKLILDELTIVKYDDETKPYLIFDKNLDTREINKGLLKVYEIATNNQFYNSDSFKENPQGTFYQFIDANLYLKIFSTEENFTKTLSSFKKNFLSNKLNEKYIKEALFLTPPVLYTESRQSKYVSRNTVNVGDDYDDYVDLIKNITFKDVEDYHKIFSEKASNSLVIVVNKDFYKQNEKEILKSITENFEITNIKYEQGR